MPFNLLKSYNDILEIGHFNEVQRTISLQAIFNRDIADNNNFKFRNKIINPIKGDEPPLTILFRHLTTNIIDYKTKRREFEFERSVRLHWILHHIEERKKNKISIFTIDEIAEGRKCKRTYILDEEEKYVVVLEVYRNGTEYYLITAYHLQNRNYKKIKSKMARKLEEVF